MPSKGKVRRATRERMTVDARRAQLLALGIRAFSERSYDEVSTEAIAQEAGISHGLLFHYFATKRAFYVAALRVAADQLLRETFELKEGAPEGRLFAGLDAYFRFVEEHAQAYAALLRGGVGSDPLVSKLVDTTRSEFIEMIRGYVKPLAGTTIDDREMRASLRGWIGLVEALSLDWIEHRDLPREARVAIAVRAIAALLPAATDALLGR